KELIDWDQQRQDVQIKYEQVVEQFEPEGILPAELQALPEGSVEPLGGDIAFNGVRVVDDNGVKLLDSVSVTLPERERVALLGGGGSGGGAAPVVPARPGPAGAGRVTRG